MEEVTLLPLTKLTTCLTFAKSLLHMKLSASSTAPVKLCQKNSPWISKSTDSKIGPWTRKTSSMNNRNETGIGSSSKSIKKSQAVLTKPIEMDITGSTIEATPSHMMMKSSPGLVSLQRALKSWLSLQPLCSSRMSGAATSSYSRLTATIQTGSEPTDSSTRAI